MKLLHITMLLLFAVGAGAQPTAVTHSITVNMMAEAERLQGLSFTPAERDSMLTGLAGQLAALEAIRAFVLDNSISPALLFNPLPAGFSLPAGKSSIAIPRPKGFKRPAQAADLAYCTIPELAELLRTRQLTSTELTLFYLERVKKYDPLLHCVITLTEERALRDAARADAEIAAGKYRGMLHGIPYGVKDLLSTADYKPPGAACPSASR